MSSQPHAFEDTPLPNAQVTRTLHGLYPDAAPARPARFIWPPARAIFPVHHRDVGALLLLRDAFAARPLHGEIPASARARRKGDRACNAQELLRRHFRPAGKPAFLLAHLWPLYRARLLHAVFWRLARRPLPRSASHHHNRRLAHGGRSFHDGVRAAVSVRADRAHPWQRLLQAQYVGPGWQSLPSRRPAPRPRLFDLLYRDQSRGAAGATR